MALCALSCVYSNQCNEKQNRNAGIWFHRLSAPLFLFLESCYLPVLFWIGPRNCHSSTQWPTWAPFHCISSVHLWPFAWHTCALRPGDINNLSVLFLGLPPRDILLKCLNHLKWLLSKWRSSCSVPSLLSDVQTLYSFTHQPVDETNACTGIFII